MAIDLQEEFRSFRKLEAGPRRDTSAHFADLYNVLQRLLPEGDDKDSTLRLLLETRDVAVRSAAALLRQGSTLDDGTVVDS